MVSINFFAIEEAMNVYQVKIEPQSIVFLFYNGIVEPPVSKIGTAFKIYYPFMLVQKFCAVHGHHYFGIMPHLDLIFWKSAHHIAQTTCLCYGVTLCTDMNYFH